MTVSTLTRYAGSYQVTCVHKRTRCICMDGQLSNEESAYQAGETHKAYGWGGRLKPEYTQSEKEAFTEGFNNYEP